MKAREVSGTVIGGIGTFLAFMTYFSEVRPYLEANLGVYGLGATDGGITVALSFAIAFYVASLFEKKPNPESEDSPPKQVKTQRKAEPKKIERKSIEELIRRFDAVGKIVSAVHMRTGDHFIREMVVVSPSEEAEYEELINLLQQNYPRVSGELNRVTRLTHIDPVLGIKVEDYDPLLQTLRFSSLKRVFDRSHDLKEFEKNIETGVARLRAYLGDL